MKKYLVLTILVFIAHFANGQCPRFLGGDRSVMPCSNPFTIVFADLFAGTSPLLFNCTFQGTSLPPVDVIPGTNGEPDVVIEYTSKTKVVATATNGCKDSAVIRVLKRRFGLPDIKPDGIVKIHLGFQQELGDITTAFTPSSVFNEIIWSTSTPQSVDTGFYRVVEKTGDGCTDTATINVVCARHFDTTVTKCAPDKFNLNNLFTKTGFGNAWRTIRITQGDTIVTSNPAAVNNGRYMLLTSKAGRCTDTVFVDVTDAPKPDMGVDRNVKKCFGTTIDVSALFFLDGLESRWNIPDSSKAETGTHRLIVTNSAGCMDTVFVTVTNNPKPSLGPDKFETICPSAEAINMNSSFPLTGLVAEWNTPNPEAVEKKGTYRLIVTNEFGCKDTANFTVLHQEQPEFLNDTIINLCFGHTKDLNEIYTIPEGFLLVDWSTATPATAGAGNYSIMIEDIEHGCRYTAIIHVDVAPNNTEILNLCKYDLTNSSDAFTTNAFRTVVVDKTGKVWAGASLGGLYRFNQVNNTCYTGNKWEKFTPSSGITTVNNTYRDLQLSNVTGDNSIWAASVGNTLPYNLTGGVDRIISFNSPVTHFGSVNGGPVNGGLSSRNVNSIAVGNSKKIYASLALSQQKRNGDFDSTLDGGTFVYNLLTNPAAFTPAIANPNTSDNRFSAAGVRGRQVWFGYTSSSAGGTISRIQKWDDVLNASAGFIDASNSPIPFGAGLEVRAILTDLKGRTFVGLNQGNGIAVLSSEESGANWTMVTTENSPLPSGATVNYNAITQVNDEIWIGTTLGLLIYNGTGSLTECGSWKIYTTANNLPSNNITDIAFNTSNFETWLTTDQGICKLVLDHRITGTVMNVSAGRYDALLPQLKQTPLKNATVRLIKAFDNSVVTTYVTDNTGNFEFTNVLPFTDYRVEVRYTNDVEYKYDFNDLKYNSNLGAILIPDSLRKELDTLKVQLAFRKFPLDLYGFSLNDVANANGYVLDDFSKPFVFYNDNIILKNYNDRVENIAIYYITLATMYNIGIQRIGLDTEEFSALFDALHSLLAFAECGAEFNSHFLLQGEKHGVKGAFVTTGIKALAVPLKLIISKLAESVDDPEAKKTIEKFSPKVSAAVDLILNTIVNGAGGTIVNEMVNFFKKILVMVATNDSYTTFCQETHKDLVKVLADQTANKTILGKYAQNYDPLYNLNVLPPPSDQSLNKQAIDKKTNIKSEVDALRNIAGVADATAGFAEATLAIAKIGAVITLGATASVAAVLQGVVFGAKVVNTSFLTLAALEASIGSKHIEILSKYLVGQSGYQNVERVSIPRSALSATTTIDTLRARKNRYNDKLNELNAIYNHPYNDDLYFKKIREFVSIDSLYTEENERITNLILPKMNFGIKNIVSYQRRLNVAIDSFYTKQHSHKVAFTLSNMAYMLRPDSAAIRQSLGNTIQALKILNDSTVNALEQVVDLGSSIPTAAYLVKDGYSIKFSNQPGDTALVTYTFKNIGNTVQNNVSFNLLKLDGGFTLTTTAFLNVGNILPGQSKQVAYQFIAPSTDTIGSYDIEVNADNGSYTDVSGVLFTVLPAEVTSIANGLWSSTSTWSNNRVPGAASNVTIKHNVTVDINASCKSINVSASGMLNVSTGITLNVLK